MNVYLGRFDRIDQALTRWMARNDVVLLRSSVGFVFFWFGALKFLPGLSPAQKLAGNTVELLSFGLLFSDTAVLILALWESLIGIGLLAGAFLRATLLLLWVQMLGTITPLFLFPGLTFNAVPFAPTLEGHYIIKNLVLVSAGIVIGATVRVDGLRLIQKAGAAVLRRNERLRLSELAGDGLSGFLDGLLVTQIVVLLRSQIVVELVDQQYPGGDVEPRDLFVRDIVQVFD